MSQALSLLGDVLTIRCRSRMLWTEPIGIVSDKFLNCLVSGITQLSFTELRSKLKDIEQLCGRLPQDKADGIIRMDIDILQFDEQRFKENDWSRDYVTLLINEIKQ